ncbi:hypothetical protein G9A89_009421 [Geosiphon pyriformis]|nr:hypothetical protein G9A89_009421 [Geosiphon pyriformis]
MASCSYSEPTDMIEETLRKIKDPNEKRKAALRTIDDKNFGWFHIRICIVSGIGFFTDAYDLFVINLISAMLGVVHFNNDKYEGNLPRNIDLGLKVSAATGTLLGQLSFGILADRYGRKQMYGIELIIMIIATVGQSFSADSYSLSIYTTIIFWRVLLGIGIGGDYPMSAVITSELASKNNRGAMMSAVFAMQGFGILSGGICSILTLAIFKNQIERDPLYIDYIWRIVTAFGVLPATLALFFRLTIPETPRFTMDVERNIEQATHDIVTVIRKGKFQELNNDSEKSQIDVPSFGWEDFKEYFKKWENAKVLIGTSASWFLLDVAFYGIGLNNSIILNAIGFAGSKEPFQRLWNVSVGNIIITMLGTVPGYWFSVFLIDSWGRKFIQQMGFIMLTIIFLVLGFGYQALQQHSIVIFILLFSLAQFFQNFGPNTTTFIVPGEVFPTRYRSTCHGISAAFGKLGALIAQVWFIQMKDIGGTNMYVGRLLLFFAFFMFLGFLVTYFIPETKRQSLEELSNEGQDLFIRNSNPGEANSLSIIESFDNNSKTIVSPIDQSRRIFVSHIVTREYEDYSGANSFPSVDKINPRRKSSATTNKS